MGLKDILVTIYELCKNKWFALIFSIVILFFISLFNRSLWGYFIAILLAYLCADLIKLAMMRKGERGTKIAVFSIVTEHSGHKYLAFLLFIILGTVISGLLASGVVKLLVTSDQGLTSLLIENCILFILVYADFKLTFPED